jgi:hypothetical protein
MSIGLLELRARVLMETVTRGESMGYPASETDVRALVAILHSIAPSDPPSRSYAALSERLGVHHDTLKNAIGNIR